MTSYKARTRAMLGSALAAILIAKQGFDQNSHMTSKLQSAEILLTHVFDKLSVTKKELNWSLRVIEIFDVDLEKLKLGSNKPEVLIKYCHLIVDFVSIMPVAGDQGYFLKEAARALQTGICALDVTMSMPIVALDTDVAIYLFKRFKQLAETTK